MKFKFLCIAAMLLMISNIEAQQGRVRVTGKVMDGITGDALPGASIIVKGSTIGTISELNGEYELMAPGEQSVLVFSFLGFEDQEYTVGDLREINVELSASAEQLDEVVVTTQAKGQIGARQSQINSNTLKNVVAPDRLQENPDANAVEAIGRLPGVSVIRSGGEGAAVVIRGLEPRYTNITLEGMNLASSNKNNRGTNLGGISQYALQGVEVYKALTPDLEANSVGGTVNLKLAEIPQGFNFSIMAQGGYNDLNNYFGNYKLAGDISNRFLDNKLGISLALNKERVNRGTQTLSAGYGLESEEVDIFINNSVLNIIDRQNHRQSATLSMDYKLHPSTTLKLYSLYSITDIEQYRQSKNYNHTGAGAVNYSMAFMDKNKTILSHSTLSGETKLNWLSLKIDYGINYSLAHKEVPRARTWGFVFNQASTEAIATYEMRRQSPADLVPLYTDHPDSLLNTNSTGFTATDTWQDDENLTGYLNFELPFSMGSLGTGNVKFGGKYREKTRKVDVAAGAGGQGAFTIHYWWDHLPHLVPGAYNTGQGNTFSLVGFEDYMVDDFLDGAFDYGWYFDFDELVGISTWWESFNDSIFSLPEEEINAMLGGEQEYLPYRQNMEQSLMDDQDIREKYYAGYLMTELNFGKWIMFLPGFRYEKTHADLKGFLATQPLFSPSTRDPAIGKDTVAERGDEFLLPQIHLRISPSKRFYAHFAYTQSISRPDFNSISPNRYVSSNNIPFVHKSRNPALKAELWTNYDLQFTFHGNKIGLLSVTGFYKNVQDKIWQRTYKRISSDPVVPPFLPNHVVQVSLWENHPYDINLKGIETEWQTSFWYLPKPLSFFTLYLNYTYTNSQAVYPKTYLVQTVPEGGGRPVTSRVDTTIVAPMYYQPDHILNASLGFNYKGLNTWLSYQYNGGILTSKNYFVDELDRLKEHFYRIDLQVTYDLPLKKLPGELQVMANMANLSNFTEVSRLRGDPRFTYMEAYGWTVDLGIRYSF